MQDPEVGGVRRQGSPTEPIREAPGSITDGPVPSTAPQSTGTTARPGPPEEWTERARELERIEALGRTAAAAGTPRELFLRAIPFLLREEPVEFVAAVHALGKQAEWIEFPARPFTPTACARLRERGAALLGPRGEEMKIERVATEWFDSALGARDEVSHEELVVTPIVRGGAPVAWLLAVPERGAGEADLRLTYAAANQLTLHLDRITSAQEREADRFRAILESMPQAVLLLDDSLAIRQANRSGLRLTGELGLAGADAGPELLRRLGLAASVEQVRRGARDQVNEEASFDDDRTFDVTVSPLSGEAGGASGLLLVLNDVTERRRLQRRLAHSEKMSSLGQMISGVAHELNNPLATILGYTQLLGARIDDEKIKSRMSMLHNEASRCRAIVQNMLSFARQREPVREALSVNDVVRSVNALMRYQLKVDNVGLETELSDDLPPVLGDRHQLQQVLVNLVTNARHAIREAGEGGTVTIRTTPREDGLLLEVIDDGPGVSEALKTTIFDPFFTTKAEGKGTGLGLSLVYGIVTSHDGTIEVVSGDAPGATFRIFLPRREPHRPARTAAEPEVAAAPVRAGRILVVDDEAEFAGLLCEALATEGHTCVSATCAQEALRQLPDGSFDLIISDLKMPGMDGRRFREALLANDEAGPKLLWVTGDTLSPETDELERRTGVPILRKPFELEELRRRVREQLDDAEGS